MKSIIESIQILPPWNDDVKFENFITAYFNNLENTLSYDRFGRSGQKQDGLDIYSTEKKTVIQCKLKLISGGNDEKIRKDLITELDTDFNSFKEYNKKNDLKYRKFIFASTFHSDTHISTECAKRTSDSIIVEYWSWDRLTSSMHDKTFRTYYGEFADFLEDYFKQNSAFTENDNNANEFIVDRAKMLIDQLNDYFKHIFSEIDILPIHLLTNNYPFKRLDTYYPYYSLFTLSTDNDQLFGLFESLIFENGSIQTTDRSFVKGVKESKKKLKYILLQLSKNLIFNLENRNSHKTINIRYSHEESCSCLRCSFGRLNYLDTFKGLMKPSIKTEDKLLFAYMHYELGNYVESAKHFEDIARKSKENNQKIRYSIAQYNLSKLYILIRNNYWGENQQPELLNTLKSINIDQVYGECKTEDNGKIIDWIINTKFYSSKREKINRTVSKIRDHYYSQLKGGWSSNKHAWELINDYAELETFINGNYIIYDRFREYHELTEVFIEGLLISHSMNENQSGRLEYFDDWLILRMIFNGNAERILKYFNRLDLNILKYKQTAEKGDSFIDILNNHLTKFEDIHSEFEKTCEKSNRIFWEKYNSIFSNLMLLASICDIEPKHIKTVSNNLLNYLKKESFISHSSFKYIRIFISSKGEHCDESVLYGFLMLQTEKDKFHELELVEPTIAQITKYHKNLTIDKSSFDNLLSFAFNNCDPCNGTHSPDFIAKIYYLTENKSYKNEIKSRIENSLNRSFDDGLYYISAIYNIFDTTDNYFNQFVKNAKPKANTASFKRVFTGIDDNRYPKVGMLLNLCFKFERDLTDKLFDDFRNIDDYYSWLFNMKDFDYNKFNPKWSTEYQTKYYFAQFRKHPIILEKIYNYLRENSDYQLEKLVVELNDINVKKND